MAEFIENTAALSEEALKETSGAGCMAYYRCSNPNCSEHSWRMGSAVPHECRKCGSPIESNMVCLPK